MRAPSRLHSAAAIAVTLMCSTPAISRAQTTAAPPRWLCNHPQPLATGCRNFVFFDAHAALGLATGRHPIGLNRTTDDLPSYGGGLIGVMSNLDSANAVGVSFELDYALTGRGSAKAHWRRWLSSGSSLDVAAGPLFADIMVSDNGGDARVRANGATGDVAFITHRGVGLFVGSDYLNGAGRSSVGVHAGVRAEGKWAVAAAAVVGTVFFVGYWALSHGDTSGY